jgi:competence protein ComEA
VNRLLVLGAVAALALLLVLHRPPAPAEAITVAPPPPSQTFRKGHPPHTPAPQSVVYVAGAVRRPGLYTLPSNARVNDAVMRAGGMLPAADAWAVNLAQRVSDGAEIRVPRLGEATPAPSHRTRARKTPAPMTDATIDLNAADAAALASLPGIGETLAARIVEYRDLNGPFASLDELADVAGMTQRRIDAIAPYLRVDGAR